MKDDDVVVRKVSFNFTNAVVVGTVSNDQIGLGEGDTVGERNTSLVGVDQGTDSIKLCKGPVSEEKLRGIWQVNSYHI